MMNIVTRFSLMIMMVISLQSFCIAQQPAVRESDRQMSSGVQNCLIMDLPKYDIDMMEDVWKDFIKPYNGKTKKDKVLKGWFTEKADISDIGKATKVGIYLQLEEKSNMVQVSSWWDLGPDGFLTSKNGSAYAATVNFLQQYAQQCKIRSIEIRLAAAEKELKSLENDQTKLEKQNKNLHEDIEDWKSKIAKAEKEIVENEQKQTLQKEKIAAQVKANGEINTLLKDAQAGK